MFGNDINYTCATDIMKKVPPRHPSSNSEHNSFDRATSAMSASSETYDDSVQVVEKVIDTRLIDNAVAEFPARSNTATGDMTTGIAWTPACEEIRKFYATKVHEKVITQTKIASFVKTPAETESTFKMVERINPTVQDHEFRRIRLPTDYHVLIPLVIEGLPPWIEVRSINKCQKVTWAKGSAVYLKGGTDLICSKEGGGVYMLIGGKNKVVA